MIHGILFDLFGTLVNYSASRVDQGYHATHKVVLDHGIDIEYPAFLNAWMRAWETMDEWSRRTEREYGMERVVVDFLSRVSDVQYAPAFVNTVWRSYVDEWSVAIRPVPGVKGLLESLSSNHCLGVVTNTHDASLVERQMDKSGAQAFMDVVVTSVQHGRPKPHPDIFADALEQLGCAAEETLFVGDSFEADYLGAKRAGMRALLIDPEGVADVPPSDVIASVLEVRTRIRASQCDPFTGNDVPP